MPPRQLPTLQRLSADHLVLELHEDERGSGDVADRGRAEADLLDGAPPLGHQREAALSLVAQGSQQRVAGSRTDVEFRPRRASSPGRARRACPFITRIGEDGQSGRRPGFGQDELAGGGQVVGAARQHVRDPQRDAARGGQRLHVPGGLVRLAGVPLVDLLALPAGLLVRAPVGGDERAVQDQVGKPSASGLVQRSRSSARPRRAPRRPRPCTGTRWPARSRSRGPAGGCRPCPGTTPARRPPASSSSARGSLPRADLAAVRGQQPRHEQDQSLGTSSMTR